MPEFDPRSYAYPSRRNVVYARKAMACTSIPQGAQIGLDVMKAGGNAVDAAVAMAAAMPLLEPTSNGLGSDCFALVWVEAEKKLYGLNASGVAPAALSAALVRELGHQTMPQAGWIPTMVPGAPAGWAELNRRFGTKPLPQLFAPAISAAREGVPVQVNLEPMWEEDARRIAAAMERDPSPHAYWWERFMKPDGTPYRAGDVFRWEEYAQTLEELADTGCESYYRGPLMEQIVAFSQATGGYFCEDDFRNYKPEWVEPISTDYKGYTVCEIPPQRPRDHGAHGPEPAEEVKTVRSEGLCRHLSQDSGVHQAGLCGHQDLCGGSPVHENTGGGSAVGGVRRPAQGADLRTGADARGRGPLLRRHHLSVYRRPPGEHGVLHPEQLHHLRRGGGHPRDWDLPPEPGSQLLTGRGE